MPGSKRQILKQIENKKKKHEEIEVNKIETDLDRFEEEYNARINEFLNGDFETRVAFLDADFGWGKTKFIKEYLEVDNRFIYSPWLNPSGNILETIYSQTKCVNDIIRLIIYFIVCIIYATMSLLFDPFYESFNPCDNSNFWWFYLIIGIILLAIIVFSISEPYFIIKVLKNIKTPILDEYLAKKICKKISKIKSQNQCLVIEDIDRCSSKQIEQILIAINKLSQYINLNMKSKKIYILVTGDFDRIKEKVDELENTAKSTDILNKCISGYIPFSPKMYRLYSIMEQMNINKKMASIEANEFINFAQLKSLSIREIVTFFKENKNDIERIGSERMDLFRLLVREYYLGKYRKIENIETKPIKEYMTTFPSCLNDFEIMTHTHQLKTGMKKFDLDGKTDNASIIKNTFYNILYPTGNMIGRIRKIYKEYKNLENNKSMIRKYNFPFDDPGDEMFADICRFINASEMKFSSLRWTPFGRIELPFYDIEKTVRDLDCEDRFEMCIYSMIEFIKNNKDILEEWYPGISKRIAVSFAILFPPQNK